MPDYLNVIFQSIAVIASLGALFIAIKKTPHETHALDGDAVESSAQAVALYSEEITKLKSRIAEMEKEDKVRDQRLDAIQRENELLRDHNTRLSAQVVSLGGTPVPMKAIKGYDNGGIRD